tara:strand:- start:31 stop:606 length:576 start_codon:yes stop_codon:yes gene_type:complete
VFKIFIKSFYFDVIVAYLVSNNLLLGGSLGLSAGAHAGLSLLSLLRDESLTLLLVAKSKQTSILGSLLARSHNVPLLERSKVTLVLEGTGSNQTLDLWGLGLSLAVLLKSTTNNVLADIILLVQLEQLTNVVSALGTETKRKDTVGKTRERSLTLLDNDDVQDREIVTDDATTDGLSAAVTITALGNALSI